MSEPRVLIWSIDHVQWWAPNEWGYTPSLGQAGRYPLDRARRIVEQANLIEVHEVAIPVEAVDASPALLASCKELLVALEGAMRVIAQTDFTDDRNVLTEAFVAEMSRIGIAAGVGFRAQDAIRQAEGTPRKAILLTDVLGEV